MMSANNLPAHARGEVRVVILPAIHLLNETDDVRGAVWVEKLKPFAKQLLEFVWQTHARIADGVRASWAQRGHADALGVAGMLCLSH
jgi:hypothetical protein